MKIAVLSTKPFDRCFLSGEKASQHEFVFFEERLSEQTVHLVAGFEAVCVFANDLLDERVLSQLSAGRTKLIALRCAGFNNVDLIAAERLGLVVVRVPEYSPYAVAEHTIALIMALNRRVCRAHRRMREGNFSLEGLLGFELHDCTVGVVGTGRIGKVVVKILSGFGSCILAVDPQPDIECLQMGARYVALSELLTRSDVITLHCPLIPETYHIINAEAIKKMKKDVMIINTGRGGLINTKDVIADLKCGKIGHLGLDVYEEEADLFYEDLSDQIIQDDMFARLMMFPNVIVTGHQGFFTRKALENIANTTIANITDFANGRACPNQVTSELVMR
ncbi:MAG: 2-hydroxyacid dehydrogenase [Planctomycetota bacterium]|jgi:D-lactate dehydrogenase